MGDALTEIRQRVVKLGATWTATGEVAAYRVDELDFEWLLMMAQRAETLAGMLDGSVRPDIHARVVRERDAALERARQSQAERQADADRMTAAVERMDAALARVAALEAVLAEPDEDLVWRLACLAGPPDHARDGSMRVLLVRRLLADLRQRAGLP